MKTNNLKSVIGLALLSILAFGTMSFENPKINDYEETLGKNEFSEIIKKKKNATSYKNVTINDMNIFYREAGDVNKPTILLLHGYPTSSHMFRNLMTDLSVQYHVIAPDYPGFGRSDQPLMKDYDYTFDNMAIIVEGLLKELNINKYSIYLMDYGAPIGFRIA
jgi:hypothetical protein